MARLESEDGYYISVEELVSDYSEAQLLDELYSSRLELASLRIHDSSVGIVTAGYYMASRTRVPSYDIDPTAEQCLEALVEHDPSIKQLEGSQALRLCIAITNMVLVNNEFLRRTNRAKTHFDWPTDLHWNISIREPMVE